MLWTAAEYELEMSSSESDTRLYKVGTPAFKDPILVFFSVEVFKKGHRGNEK